MGSQLDFVDERSSGKSELEKMSALYYEITRFFLILRFSVKKVHLL